MKLLLEFIFFVVAPFFAGLIIAACLGNFTKWIDRPVKSPTVYTVVTEYGTYPGIRHKPYVGYVNESGKRHNFHGSYVLVEE